MASAHPATCTSPLRLTALPPISVIVGGNRARAAGRGTTPKSLRTGPDKELRLTVPPPWTGPDRGATVDPHSAGLRTQQRGPVLDLGWGARPNPGAPAPLSPTSGAVTESFRFGGDPSTRPIAGA